MKKVIFAVLLFVCILALAGCGMGRMPGVHPAQVEMNSTNAPNTTAKAEEATQAAEPITESAVETTVAKKPLLGIIADSSAELTDQDVMDICAECGLSYDSFDGHISYQIDETNNYQAGAENLIDCGCTTLILAARGSADATDEITYDYPDITLYVTEAAKFRKEITDVDPAELPESLKHFFVWFNLGNDTDDDSQYHREFDSSNLDSCYNTLVGSIVHEAPCVNLYLYPFYDYKQDWTSQSDPLGKIKYGYVSYTKEQIIWVMKNIFHISDDEIDGMFEAAYSSEDYLYEYEAEGTMRLYNFLWGHGDPGWTVTFVDARFDGEKYYIVYYLHGIYSAGGDLSCRKFYAEVSEIEYEGNKYWSIYRHTENIPDLPAPTNGENVDVFEMFEGDYNFTWFVGGRVTDIELKSDGTFTGRFDDVEGYERGDGYDGTTYISIFNGRFSNPKRINYYTYSFELSDIEYEIKPGTETIEEVDWDPNYKMRIEYTDAYGLEETKTIYAYISGTPTVLLYGPPMAWIGGSESSTRYDTNVSYRCLFSPESESFWIESKP